MKKWLLFLFLFTAHAAFAQKVSLADQNFLDQQRALKKKCPRCGCSIKVPFSHIGEDRAGKRFQRFNEKTSRCGLDHLAKKVSYSPEGAKDLLDSLTARNYDGFRAYFAVYPSEPKSKSAPDSGYKFVPNHQGGKLTLIYVPTNKDAAVQHRHPDDTSHCMIIKDNKAEIITATIASLWIMAAEKQILPILEKDAQRDHPNFLETHSLWFSNTPVRNSLLGILKCRICCNSITSVDAKFGAFLKVPVFHENDYKLTVVFTLVNGNSTNFISLYAGDALGAFPVAADSGGSDTGKPCPPPTNCNTSRGAFLPAQP